MKKYLRSRGTTHERDLPEVVTTYLTTESDKGTFNRMLDVLKEHYEKVVRANGDYPFVTLIPHARHTGKNFIMQSFFQQTFSKNNFCLGSSSKQRSRPVDASQSAVALSQPQMVSTQPLSVPTQRAASMTLPHSVSQPTLGHARPSSILPSAHIRAVPPMFVHPQATGHVDNLGLPPRHLGENDQEYKARLKLEFNITL